MNYIGSKLTLLDFLETKINEITEKKCNVFCDLFSGTGVVGSFFKNKGYQILANDIQYYSYVLARNYIGNCKSLEFCGLEKDVKGLESSKNKELFICNYLSKMPVVKGFIYNNYSYGGTQNKEYTRRYFSDSNAMKCDGIRMKIDIWKKEKKINDDEYFFLLASLIESIDKYANTASVYGAFLKKLKKTAQKDLIINPAKFSTKCNSHKVFNEDANDVVKKIVSDILYLDPPYNQRQYATNYHLLETIALYDDPDVNGVTGLRNYKEQKSNYCSRVKVKDSFKDLITNAETKYIFLSYNNEGLMTHNDIKDIMSTRGEYGFFTRDYSRFRADKEDNRNHKSDKTVEYLHYVICDPFLKY